MKTLKWLLVGAGEISSNRVAPAITAARNSELTAVCDLSVERASTLAKKHSVSESFADMDQALSQSDVDAVYIAVPVALHIPLGLKAIAAGKHVIVEKPMGLNSRECRRLLDVAESSGLTAGCAYYRRFTGQYRLTNRLLDNNEIDRIVGGSANYQLHMNVRATLNGSQKWIFDKKISGGGILCHLGSHVFDVIVGLLGLPVNVSARCGTINKGISVEDHASVIMELRDGGSFTACFNWNSIAPCRHDFEICGAKGRVSWPVWPPHGDGPVVVSCGKENTEIEVENAPNFHLPLVQDFVDSINEGRKPVCSAREGWKTGLLMDAVYRSAEENRVVQIEENR